MGMMAPAYLILGAIAFAIGCVSIIAAIDLITRLGNALGFG